MEQNIRVKLGPVQETLLIPLLGRAVQTRKKTGLIDDPTAVEIIQQLDYDFSKWEKSSSLIGASIRTRMFDEDVTEFMEKHLRVRLLKLAVG